MRLSFKTAYVPAMLLAMAIAPMAQAATTPSLGAAASYGVLGGTYTNTVPGTTINGDVGFTTGPAVAPAGVHNHYGAGAPYATAGTDQGSALSALAAQPCTFTFAAGAVNLSTDITHGTAGVYAPGVYCSNGAMDVGGPLSLSGSGTYIFRAVGALTSTAGATVSTAGADACDVFWTPTQATTLAANTTFIGTIISNAGITVGANTNWTGRSLAFGGTVTSDTDTITVPSCAAPVVVPPSPSNIPPIINVEKVPSPLALPAGPGPVTYTYTVNNPGQIALTNVTLTDDSCSNVSYVSGDTNSDAVLQTSETWKYTCLTTLNRTTINFATATGQANGMSSVDTAIAEVIVGVPVVPPLIHILKTPNPLVLPSSGGSVTYSYVVNNPGTVALNNVTVTDNKCTNVTFVSGDGNGDSLLQAGETWRYTCTTNLSQATVNTAVATGHANGLTAIDTALATVTLAGQPIPPLIHIIKRPDPVILPAAGGTVTYTYTVTNPGTVTLSNVGVVDDHCGPVNLISGDANGNGVMETSETWTYTCAMHIGATTTNTATATGSGNGFTVTDVSVANVAVSPALIPPPPTLPNTGFNPSGVALGWMVALAGLFAIGSLAFVLKKKW